MNAWHSLWLYSWDPPKLKSEKLLLKKNEWELLCHWKKSILLFGFMSNFSVIFFIRSEMIKGFHIYKGSELDHVKGVQNSIQIQTEIGNYYSHSAIKSYLWYICTGLILLQLLIKNCLNIEYNPRRCLDRCFVKTQVHENKDALSKIISPHCTVQ